MPRTTDLNEMKLAIKEAVEPLVKQHNQHDQTLYGENRSGGLLLKVENNAKEFDNLRGEFKEEKAKIKGAVAATAAIGTIVGSAISFVVKMFLK